MVEVINKTSNEMKLDQPPNTSAFHMFKFAVKYNLHAVFLDLSAPEADVLTRKLYSFLNLTGRRDRGDWSSKP